MAAFLAWVARQGRYCLIAGLAAGLAFPGIAEALRPWVAEFIVALLVVTGARVGARAALGSLDALGPAMARIACLQALLPLAALAIFSGSGLFAAPLALAVVLMLAAPSLTGAPNFAIMIGHDPAPGMRLVVLSTLLFPLTALPVLAVLDPAGTGPLGAVRAALMLLVAILGAVGVGFAIRRVFPQLGGDGAKQALDGFAALLLAVVVVGLMAAIGPLLRGAPGILLLWLLAAVGVNFGLVFATLAVTRRAGLGIPIATAIYAGNRNIALFLIVLPEAAAEPLMIFIGCYQIPMYLTPLVLSRFAKARRAA